MCGLLVWARPHLAFAQDEAARAEKLFRDGGAALKRGEVDEACSGIPPASARTARAIKAARRATLRASTRAPRAESCVANPRLRGRVCGHLQLERQRRRVGKLLLRLELGCQLQPARRLVQDGPVELRRAAMNGTPRQTQPETVRFATARTHTGAQLSSDKRFFAAARLFLASPPALSTSGHES